jgi:hypothetical protein
MEARNLQSGCHSLSYRVCLLIPLSADIYFRNVGENPAILPLYFERHGSVPFPKGVNPAELVLEVAGANPGSHLEIDWRTFQLDSDEDQAVKAKLHQLMGNHKPVNKVEGDAWTYKLFAVPLTTQTYEV